MASEPEVKLPSYLSKEPRMPDEPFDEIGNIDIDRFEIKEPDEPQMQSPFEFMDNAYDKDSNQPPEPEEERDSFHQAECPTGIQCDDPAESLLHKPPYLPSEPIFREVF